MRTDGRPRKKSVLLDKLAYKCPTLYLGVAVKHTMNFTSCIVQELNVIHVLMVPLKKVSLPH